MSSYKPADSKREEYRKYLDRSGIMDALTKALVKLYEEEERPGPDDAMGYFLKLLGGVKADEYEANMAKLQDLEDKMGSSTEQHSSSTVSSAH